MPEPAGLFEQAESSIPIEDENLKGNAAYLHEVLAQDTPANIITPKGYWYSGPTRHEVDNTAHGSYWGARWLSGARCGEGL